MSKHAVMTYKVPIVKPVSTDWNTFGKVAGDLVYNAIQIMNDAMGMNYVHVRDSYRHKQETGKSLSVKEKYGVATYATVISRELKERYKELDIPGDLLEQIIRQALDIFKTNNKEVLKGNAVLTTFRRDQPIPVRGRSLKLTEDYKVNLPFMSATQAKELGFTGANKQSFQVQLGTPKNVKILLNRILSGEYGLCDSKVQRTLNGKWFLLLTYKQPVAEKNANKDNVMGIDLGIEKAAYMALSHSKQNFFIDGGEVESYRRRVRGRRKSLQNQLRVCSDNRRGHGKKTLLKPLEKLSEKESNFRSTVNHRYSKRIVEWAVNNEVGVIQMEDLSGINKLSSFLANWDYYDLQTKIEYKARLEGIEVVKIDPSYTSQRCNECGHIAKENRAQQEVFECKECGHKTNADLNAARNIAVKGIEKLIKEELKKENPQKVG